MTTRILRYADNGHPVWHRPGVVIRTRPHACGRNCPRHELPLEPALPVRKKRKKRAAR